MTELVAATKALPPITPESQPYWDGCSEGQLLIQRCEACGAYQFYPRLMCTSCGNESVVWVKSSGQGKVKSYTIIRRAVSQAYEPDVPYVVALIELAEGPIMMSNIISVDAEIVYIGQPVSVEFEKYSEEISVPIFRPVV